MIEKQHPSQPKPRQAVADMKMPDGSTMAAGSM